MWKILLLAQAFHCIVLSCLLGSLLHRKTIDQKSVLCLFRIWPRGQLYVLKFHFCSNTHQIFAFVYWFLQIIHGVDKTWGGGYLSISCCMFYHCWNKISSRWNSSSFLEHNHKIKPQHVPRDLVTCALVLFPGMKTQTETLIVIDQRFGRHSLQTGLMLVNTAWNIPNNDPRKWCNTYYGLKFISGLFNAQEWADFETPAISALSISSKKTWTKNNTMHSKYFWNLLWNHCGVGAGSNNHDKE